MLILGGFGLWMLAIPGLWIYMSATATSLHPNPQEAPSVVQSGPLPRWEDAVARGRQMVRAGLTGQNLPGLSVAVGIGSELVWAEGFGFADLERLTPVKPKHRFRIGTASTVLTSAAAGLLLERGKMKLDDLVQTHVPAFPGKQWPVTLRHLMGHMAGVINDGGDEGPLFGQHCDTPVEALPHFTDSPLLFEPGTKYRYSNYGWIVVSAAVESAGGEPFLKFMREQVFEPLGMGDTIADPAPDVQADASMKKNGEQVTFYFPRFMADPKYGPGPMRELNYSCYSGASVFQSTAPDLVRFGMGIQNGKLLQRATVELLQKSQQLRSGEDTGYGLGWDLENVTLAGKQTVAVGHDGDSLGGMVASLITFPEQGIVVSVISNSSYADTSTLAVSIAQAFAESGANPARK